MCKQNCDCLNCQAKHISNATGDDKSKHLILVQDIGGYLGLIDQGVDIFNKIKHPNMQPVQPNTPVNPNPQPLMPVANNQTSNRDKGGIPTIAIVAGGGLLILLLFFVLKKGGGNA